MVPICSERWCTEANEATQTHCYNPVAPAYPVWAYYAHGRQRRCQEDPVNLPSSRLEKTTRSSPHHVAQHCPTGSEKKHHFKLPEAADLAQNHPLWMMSTYGTTQSQNCITEMTTTKLKWCKTTRSFGGPQITGENVISLWKPWKVRKWKCEKGRGNFQKIYEVVELSQNSSSVLGLLWWGN